MPSGWDACWDDMEAATYYPPRTVVLLVGGTCRSVMETCCRWFNFSALGFLPMVVDVFIPLCNVYGSEGACSLVVARAFVAWAFVAGKP